MKELDRSFLLEGLTSAQREAVQHVEGPLLTIAGPGSGKTRVVTHRIANLLLSRVPARQILALTFTNKAADEMRARLETLAPGQRVWVGTFHRFCARLLRDYASLAGLEGNFTIYDTSDSLNALKRAMEAMDFDPQHFTPGQIAHGISWAKNHLITPSEYTPRPGHALGTIIAKVYGPYEKWLLNANAVDFDDLLLHIAILLRENEELRRELDSRYRFILVDEYQDTNLPQYAIVRALSLNHPNLAVTGDPDQSIYGWRGANLNNILDFENDYPNVRVIRLEENFRSTKRILRVAGDLIENNTRRKKKALFTGNDDGALVRFATYRTQESESESIALRIEADVREGLRRPRDFAIFYRVNALSRALEAALRDHRIPYQIVRGVEFYQRAEIKDIVAYLMLLNNPRDSIAFLRIINTPTRGIGRTTLKRLEAHAAKRGMPLLQAAREAGMIAELPKKAAVTLATFVAMYDRMSLYVARPVEEIVGYVLSESGYRQMLSSSESEEDADRLANVLELLTAGRQFDERSGGNGSLEEFLEDVCLVNDSDDWESETDKVTLMSLHASKGLEFPVVFMVAVEEGLLPHERSQEPEQLEEERRLMFVGLTRAREELQLSMARYREFRGQRNMTVPSQFLRELPLDEMECTTEATPRSIEAFAEESSGHSPEESEWAPVEDDISFDVAEFESSPAFEEKAPGVRLTTAAELANVNRAAELRVPVEAFSHGMIVMHPGYGAGRIVALSGAGPKRMATVDFGRGGERKFVLAVSPLRPVQSHSDAQDKS